MSLDTQLILRRHEKLTRVLENSALDGLVINPSPSITYLTGMHFHLMERPIVAFFKPGKTPALVLPELEMLKTAALGYELNTFPYNEDPTTWIEAFRAAAQSMEMLDGKIGVEAGTLRVLELEFLKEAMQNAEFIPAEGTLAALRMYKDEFEQNSMRRAAEIAQNALRETLPLIKIGMTEQELASELVIQLHRAGTQPTLPFSPIVSTGPNGANPHASPSQRKLAAGDLLVIDFGATSNDYYSDITRTFGVGEVQEEYALIHQITQNANAAARAIAGPGVSCAAIDIAARQVIEDAGYGKYFIHRTGHGLGMQTHEEPYIRGDNHQLLEPGMTFTIEPGIYLPERSGVRIEDDVLVTESGLESFSSMPRELVTVG